MRPRSLLCALAVAAAAATSAPAATAEVALNVVPHGQQAPGVPWANEPGMLPADTQARMYDRIIPRFRSIGPDVLTPSADGSGYFKSAALVAEDDPSLITNQVVSGESPAAGAVSARIRRDAYGVPHIYSDTDPGAIFGAGYVTATDQNLLVQTARTSGVAALIDLPGASAITLVLELYNYAPSAKVVAEATELQTRSILRQGERGARLMKDIDTYIAGMNKRYSDEYDECVAKGTGACAPGKPITRTDIYALNAIKSQFLGEGGGQEVENALLLDRLQSSIGRRNGARAWNDLRNRNDPEASVTTTKSFPWATKTRAPGKGSGEVDLRAATWNSTAVELPGKKAKAASAPIQRPNTASNILILSGKRSATGRPLFVGGPQIGLNYPGLTMEEQISSPSIKVRGSTSAPFPGYALIGRGEGFAWSLTSAAGDIIDTYAERLCGGSRTKYMYKGRCRKMERVDAGTISKGGDKVAAVFWRTVHGPVRGYARTRKGNRLVALTTRRSSYGRETVDLLFNQALTYGEVKNASSFVAAAQRTPQTFNSFYASANESAFYTSGALPLRPKGVDPTLPVDGQGGHEWRGELPKNAHPHVINPANGEIINWNNKPARDFPASDDRFGMEGGIQRNELLLAELRRHTPKATLADVLSAENAASTEDVRAVVFWPTLKAMLARGKAPSARARTMVAVLDRWHRSGGRRLDAQRDGRFDDPGLAVMDAIWPDVTTAAMCGRLSSGGCKALDERTGVRFGWQGQYDGWHQFMDKDLRTILGRPVKGRYALRYCGRGSAKRCSASLWKAIDRAGRRAAAKSGSDPRKWHAKETWNNFAPIKLFDMRYSNKPTGIQQVMSFGD